MSAAVSNIPHTSDRHTESKRVPGWNERGEPKRQKSLFWHGLWVDCGCPRNGVVAHCMRRSPADNHYAVWQVKREEDVIVRDRIANALIDDPSRSFWTEVKKIRTYNKVWVDGCTDENSIAQLFANKYSRPNLFSSVPYDAADMLTPALFTLRLARRSNLYDFLL